METDMVLKRNDDEGDGLDGSPWWVKAIVRIGVPSAIACVLVWFLMNNVTSALSGLKTDVYQMQSVLATTAAAVDRQEKFNAEMLSYMRLICVNTSKNANDRSSCLNGR